MEIKKYKTKMGSQWTAVVELHQAELFNQNRYILRRVDEGADKSIETFVEVLPADTTEAEARSFAILSRKKHELERHLLVT